MTPFIGRRQVQDFCHRGEQFGSQEFIMDRQAETTVRVDHVLELEPAAVCGGVELEILGPDPVGGVITSTLQRQPGARSGALHQ